ncbi:VOC family protein [Burkholderia sp. Ax-1719]|nr:VOC family protein [Burkholderia sp. Ax-1719]
MHTHMRIARPVSNLALTERMYCASLELTVLAKFQDHDGFDGVMLGNPDRDYHFEFTHCTVHPVTPTPTREDLLVFYVPDRQAWQATCDRLVENGFLHVASLNPYWDVAGRTFADADGYRIVLQNAAWKP